MALYFTLCLGIEPWDVTYGPSSLSTALRSFIVFVRRKKLELGFGNDYGLSIAFDILYGNCGTNGGSCRKFGAGLKE